MHTGGLKAVRFKITLLAGALVLLAGCGGGSGSKGPKDLVYSGNTSAAVITTSSAVSIVALVLGDGFSPDALKTVSTIQSENHSYPAINTGAAPLVLRLSDTLNRAMSAVGRHQPTLSMVTAVAFNETIPCGDNGNSGSFTMSGNLNDDLTGTVSIRFDNCQEDGETVNGNATLRIDAYAFSSDVLTDWTLKFTRLDFNSSDGSFSMSGAMHLQTYIHTNNEIATLDLIIRNNATGGMVKTENLIISTIYDNVFFPQSGTESYSGRVYDSQLGYVDISTSTPLVYSSLSLDYPDGGGVMLLAGAAGTSIRVSATSADELLLAVDADGDGEYETSGSLPWTRLDFAMNNPDDSDSDGLPSEWEETNGLDPADFSDAGLDPDDDGLSNAGEYQAGTEMNNPDSDGDGMPDGWELKYGLQPLDESDAGLDPDGDGYLNIAEYMLNMEPTENAKPSKGIKIELNRELASFTRVPTGLNLLYFLTITNYDQLNTTIDLNIAIPTGFNYTAEDLIFIGGPTECQWSDTTRLINCSVSLRAGDSETLHIYPDAASEGNFTITATATSMWDENSPVSTSDNITIVAPGPDIQARIDAAESGDTITIEPGLYLGSFTFSGKDVTLQSREGPAVTHIFGTPPSNIGWGGSIDIGPLGTLRGFTIANGQPAIYTRGSGSMIHGNIFQNNGRAFLLSSLAAIYSNSSSPIIEGNRFRYNHCDSQPYSGVIAFGNSASPLIRNNIFEYNSCPAIDMPLPDGPAPVVINNSFYGNHIAIRIDSYGTANQVYRNNLFVRNGIGLLFDDINSLGGLNVWENNLVYGNGIAYSGIANPSGTNGNISADPLFVDAANGDYQLSAGSPAIDTGSSSNAPSDDYDGASRPVDGDSDDIPVTDIGAFEYQ